MPAPTLQGSSAIVAATATTPVSPVLPAHAIDDILVVRVWARTTTGAFSCADVGWSLARDVTNRSTIAKYAWFWKRATSAAETSPTISAAGGLSADKYAQAHVIRGCKKTGFAWDASASTSGTADPAVITGVTTLGLDRLIALLFGDEDNLDTQMIVTATDPASLGTSTVTNNRFVTSATGSDGGTGIAAAAKATRGATGDLSADLNGASRPGWGAQVLSFIPIPPGLTLRNYRFRNDDGDEATATWMAAENTGITIPDNAPQFRLRCDVLGDTIAGGTDRLKLQRSLNGGAWTDVLTSSNAVKIIASPNVADGAATTDQLSGSGTFAAGTFDEAEGYVEAVNLTLNGHTEVEFSIQLLEFDVAPGDVITLRLVQTYPDSDVVITYAVLPTITIGGGTTPIAGTDSGSGADTGSLAAAVPATDAQGSTTETTTPNAAIPATDVQGSTTESAAVTVPIASADAGAAGADASALAAQAAGADVQGSTTEAVARNATIPASDAQGATTEQVTPIATLPAADASGSTTESASVSQVTPKAGTDASGGTIESATFSQLVAAADISGVASEIAALLAAVSGSDLSGALSEATVLAVSVSGADANAAVVETGSLTTRIAGTDVGASLELASLIATLAAADQLGTTQEATDLRYFVLGTDAAGATTEQVAITFAILGADASGGSTETALITAISHAVSDVGSGSDNAVITGMTVFLTVSDSGVGSDLATILAQRAGSDVGTSIDTALSVVSQAGSDSLGSILEQAFLAANLLVSDLGLSLDTGVLKALASGQDVGFGAESTAVGHYGSDSGVAADNAATTASLVAFDQISTIYEIASLVAFLAAQDESGEALELARAVLQGMLPAIRTGQIARVEGGRASSIGRTGSLSESSTGKVRSR